MINRRRFLQSTAGGLLTTTVSFSALTHASRLLGQTPAASPSPSPSASPTPPPTPVFKPLRRGVGYFTARGGTIGWLVSKSALAAVDTQFPDTAKLFLDGLPERGGRPFDLLFNTHHHGDHTAGNLTFKQTGAVPAETTIVAHKNVPDLQRAAATTGGNTLENQVYAATLFDAEWKRDLGDETVRAYHFGPAHTGGDAVLHFEKANVVHVGDLVFNKLYPFIDRRGGASITGWMSVLEKLHKQFAVGSGGLGTDTIFIFGHGKPDAGVTGTGRELLEMRGYLAGLLEFVRKEIAAGKSKDDILKNETLPGFEAYHDPKPNRLAQNLTAAFEELSGAPKG